MKRSFIAMGTNIEPRKKYIDDAITRLRDHGQIEVKQISPIYETEPVGYLEQADFLNLVIEVQTNLAPKALLEACQEIESDRKSTRLKSSHVAISYAVFSLNNYILYNNE